MSIVTPSGLHVVGCWTKAGLASCVHIKGIQRGEELLFDCGIVEPLTFSASHVFCTHGHIDHIGAAVSHARARALTHSPATYYMPENCIDPILAVKAAFEILDEREIPMLLMPIHPGEHVFITPNLKVMAFPTIHRVRSQGYAVYALSKSNVIREEYRHLSRRELHELAASKEKIHEDPIEKLQICYTGDTIMSGLLQTETLFIFEAPLLIMELTYIDGDPSKGSEWGHIHISDVVANASLFGNSQILFVHLSQKYQPYGRAIKLLISQLPPQLLSKSAVSLFSFGAPEFVTRLDRDFSADSAVVGWGWARRHLSSPRSSRERRRR